MRARLLLLIGAAGLTVTGALAGTELSSSQAVATPVLPQLFPTSGAREVRNPGLTCNRKARWSRRVVAPNQVRRDFAAAGLRLEWVTRTSCVWSAATPRGAVTVQVALRPDRKQERLIVALSRPRQLSGYFTVRNVLVTWTVSPAELTRVRVALSRLRVDARSAGREVTLP